MFRGSDWGNRAASAVSLSFVLLVALLVVLAPSLLEREEGPHYVNLTYAPPGEVTLDR